MRFLRLEFQIVTPILHNSQFISGHYFHRYFKHNTNALGIIVSRRKWDGANKSDFFVPYTLPAISHYEAFNVLSRTTMSRSISFQYRRIYSPDNLLIVDFLDPTDELLQEVQDVIRTVNFQVGGKESSGYGICRYRSANVYEHTSFATSSNEFVVEFMSDFIPRKKFSIPAFLKYIQTHLPQPLPQDYRLDVQSLPDIEEKQYYIKKGMQFQVIPQFFLIQLKTNYPEFNRHIAELGLRGIGQLKSAGFGKFRLRPPECSPFHYHKTYVPTPLNFSADEKQFLRAALLHDVIPKVGGTKYISEQYESNPTVGTLLLQLHDEWHELRQKQTIKLKQFLQSIEDRYNTSVAAYYYKLALADQLAASMTRVKRVPTFSRYVIGHNLTQKIDLLQLSSTLLSIDTPFKLWKFILKSPELAVLNESLDYGDQPLSTHLLLTLCFGIPLLRGKAPYVLAKLVPHRKKKFIQGFWYKIFNIIQQKEVWIYVIEEKIPKYPDALVKKILVKSIRPETSWFRIR